MARGPEGATAGAAALPTSSPPTAAATASPSLPVGRPRSQRARRAVLEAVDDLLVEQGYAAMTLKGIAERAGVGRQTIYRWWSTKAEILLEACAIDARDELATPPQADSLVELSTYLDALTTFLTTSDAGLAYRALLGEAQHDRSIEVLLRRADVLDGSARAVLRRLRERGAVAPDLDLDLASAELIGPTLYRVLVRAPRAGDLDIAAHVRHLAGAWGYPAHRPSVRS